MEIVQLQPDLLLVKKSMSNDTHQTSNGEPHIIETLVEEADVGPDVICTSDIAPASSGVVHSNVHESVIDNAAAMSETETVIEPAMNQNAATVVGDGIGEHINDLAASKSADPTAVIQAEQAQQLATLAETVKLLVQNNEELQKSVAVGTQKIVELQAACADVGAKNKELEQEVMRLNTASERYAGEIAMLTTSVTQLVNEEIEHLDKKAASLDTAGGIPMPTVEQRVAELEIKSDVSLVRFTEFATTLEQIERDLQRYLRRHSLIVENLCPKEDRSACEAFLIFVNHVLGVTADESDIDGLHLVDKHPTASAGADGVKTAAAGSSSASSPAKTAAEQHRPRPVLITFTCFRTRTRVYKAWLSYRVGASGGGKVAAGALSGERGQGVCIREYLTAAQESVYQSAVDVRHRRPDVITDCWTFRGRSFVRTAQGDVREFTEAGDLIPKDDGKTSSCLVM